MNIDFSVHPSNITLPLLPHTTRTAPLPLMTPNPSSETPFSLKAAQLSVNANINSNSQNQNQNNQRYRYQSEIQAMMYTFGDVRHPLSSTSLLIEDIVHSQMIELLIKVSGIVSRRGARAIAPEDLLFLLRHDVNRSARLKEFLSWKDVRKNAKATGGAEGKDAETGASANTAGGDDSALVAEIEEDAKNLAASETISDGVNSNSNEFEPSTRTSKGSTHSAPQIGPKRRQLGLFWDLGHGLLADLPGGVSEFGPLTSYDSRDQSTCQRETLRRLRHADLVTLSMSQAEYLEYSECRQASFTFKKARKFREWLVGGTARPGSLALATLAGGSARDLARLNDDTLEILGFLAYEIVQKLTEVSLAVKFEQEQRKDAQEKAEKKSKSTGTNSSLGGLFTNPQNTSNAPNSQTTHITNTTNNTNNTTTSIPAKTPIQVHHVEEAFRKLISPNIDGFNLFRGTLNKKRKFIL